MIKETIKKILREELEVPEEKLKEETLPLTGEYFGLAPRDMVYLLFRLEQSLNMRLEIKDMIHYEFSSIQGIDQLIRRQRQEEGGVSCD